MTTTRSSIAGLAIVGLFVLGACGSDDNSSSATNAPAGSAAPTGSAAAGAAVTGSIDVAVHADADGAPGPVVGHAAIPEGDSSKVVITLDAPVTTGSFWPMLHLDAGTIGTYEFPGPDGPVKSGSDIVMKQITLTVS